MKKRLVAFILCVIMVCSFTICCYAESSINEARNGVARIYEMLYVDDQPIGGYVGTGFFVGEAGEDVQYLVTNYHVISYYMEYGKGSKFVYEDNDGPRNTSTEHVAQVVIEVYLDADNYIEAYPVDYDEDQDIAVLKLEKSTDKRQAISLRIPTDDMVGDTMYVVGYPWNAEEYIEATSKWNVEDAMVSKGTIGKLTTESGTGNKWIQSSDTTVSSGNSGGPLLDENGNAIGVACMICEGAVENYMNFGVNIAPVVDMLRKNNVEFTMAEDETEETPEPVIEETPEPAVEETPEPAVEEEPEKEGINPVIIAAAAAAAAIIAAIVIIALKSKKKKASEQEVIQKTVPAASIVRGPSPVVRSMAAQHACKKVSMKKGSIVVGRSKDCDIIFKDDTPGVSSKHCAITWDASSNSFIVKDMGSTYGTFLESGMKLDANRTYRIKPGESIYLGEKANTLKVEIE